MTHYKDTASLTRFRLLTYLIFPLSLTSACEREFSLDGFRDKDTENILVVNAILNPDSPVMVSVTHPYFFSEPHTNYPPVQDLNVVLTDDDGIPQHLEFDKASQVYKNDIRPRPGSHLRLEITGDNQSVKAFDTIPHKVEIERIEVSGEGPVHIYWDNDYRFTYKITFQDTPGVENFYFLAVDEDRLNTEFSQMGQVDYTIDYVFNVLAEMINKDIQGWRPDGVFGYPFTDKGIDGQRYTITVSEIIQSPWTNMIDRLPRKVKLYSISRSYFEYMVSILSQNYDKTALQGNLLSLGLMEPTKIYTNIEAGAGIFGCYNLSSVKIDILQMTGGWPQ